MHDADKLRREHFILSTGDAASCDTRKCESAKNYMQTFSHQPTSTMNKCIILTYDSRASEQGTTTTAQKEHSTMLKFPMHRSNQNAVIALNIPIHIATHNGVIVLFLVPLKCAMISIHKCIHNFFKQQQSVCYGRTIIIRVTVNGGAVMTSVCRQRS